MEWMAMDRRYARGFNTVAREELWERWQHGESLKAIGRAFGKPSSSIYFQVAPHGGIRPARRRRSRLALTLNEREEISRGIAAARSIRSMARLLGHALSTVSREIRGYPTLAKVANKDTQTVVSALIKQAKTMPNALYRSLTWDRGKELADHRRFTLATNVDVYFCDPQSPWQRGSNENTNGLLRQYFPKGTDLSVYTQTQLNRVARAQRAATQDVGLPNPSRTI